MNLRLSKTECHQLLLWGTTYQLSCADVGIPFQLDEIKLMEKLRGALNRD